MLTDIKIDLQLAPLIDKPPISSEELYKNACSGDQVTIKTWKDIWVSNYQSCKDRFGTIGDHSWGKLYGVNKNKPMIVIGSGPSLKNQINSLRENQTSQNPIMTVSCLHNLSYFVQEGIEIDYYFTLDAGPVVLKDAVELNGKDPSFYWSMTKGKKLLAYAASDPGLWEKWQGEVYLFNCLLPDFGLRTKMTEIEKFTHYVSSGGNAGGGATYFAKMIAGSNPLYFVGFDFCFDYHNVFHAWESQYDNYEGKGIGQVIRWPDIYGVPRSTWPSYLNFKFFMDYLTQQVPGDYVSCSQGIMGAYPQGNIKGFQYKTLYEALLPYQMNERVFIEERNVSDNSVVGRKEFQLSEILKNPQYEHDLTFY